MVSLAAHLYMSIFDFNLFRVHGGYTLVSLLFMNNNNNKNGIFPFQYDG